MSEVETAIIIEYTAAIVAAYVSNNAVTASDLPSVIASVHLALSGIADPNPASEPIELKPAVPVSKSVFADHLVSLETGKSFKSLKRHLSTLGMTPDEYRAKWGLPRDYPMVCSDYSKVRSGLAKTIGLGVKAEARPQLAS